MPALIFRHLTIGIALFGLIISSGCMNPAMYYGNPYNQPIYAPPRMLPQSAPGSLVIPESGDAPYDPGNKTYDSDPDDDFNRSIDDDSRFFQPDDGVPSPRDLNSERFDNDLGGPTTMMNPTGRAGQAGNIRRVAHSDTPLEYGFDRNDYTWLRGTLHYVRKYNAWLVQYSIAATDRHGGSLILDVSDRQLNGLNDGDAVDVNGAVIPNADQRGSHVYRVDAIQPAPTR